MIPGIFNVFVAVKRREDVATAPRDSLNNPVYGTPTVGWNTIYASMKVRLAFSGKPIDFAMIGERVTPNGVMYFPPQYDVRPEDRIITATGIEYTVISVVEGIVNNVTLDHKEAVLQLP